MPHRIVADCDSFTVPHAMLLYFLGMAGWILVWFFLLVVMLKLRRRWETKPVRRRLLAAGMGVWMLLILLTGCEFAFALLYDQTDSFKQSNVAKRWYERHVTLNTAGFRDDLRFPPKDKEKHLLVFAGDSFTFGHGVRDPKDRFSDRIRERLEATHAGRFHVANTGVPGMDLRQLLDGLLKKWGNDDVPIKTLVYTIVLNDIEHFDPRTAEHYQKLASMNPGFFVFRETYLLNFLYYRYQQWAHAGDGSYYDYLAEGWSGKPWERFRDKLDQLREHCSERNIDLRIVIFPFLHDLSDEYVFRSAHQKLCDYFRRHKVRCLDLLPVLEKQSKSLTVNRFDAHPNELAHSLAAEAMEKDLLDDLFR